MGWGGWGRGMTRAALNMRRGMRLPAIVRRLVATLALSLRRDPLRQGQPPPPMPASDCRHLVAGHHPVCDAVWQLPLQGPGQAVHPGGAAGPVLGAGAHPRQRRWRAPAVPDACARASVSVRPSLNHAAPLVRRRLATARVGSPVGRVLVGPGEWGPRRGTLGAAGMRTGPGAGRGSSSLADRRASHPAPPPFLWHAPAGSCKICHQGRLR